MTTSQSETDPYKLMPPPSLDLNALVQTLIDENDELRRERLELRADLEMLKMTNNEVRSVLDMFWVGEGGDLAGRLKEFIRTSFRTLGITVQALDRQTAPKIFIQWLKTYMRGMEAHPDDTVLLKSYKDGPAVSFKVMRGWLNRLASEE